MERTGADTSLTSKPTIVLLGAGNVATHLYGALSQVCNVVQVWSRNITHAERLIADSRISHPVSDLTDIVTDADYYIISVPDNAISAVANHLPQVSGVVAHTSGSVGMQVLCNANAYGVFYPLQTFSREKKVNIAETPFFIEGCNEATTAKLECLARTISTTVLRADSQQRASLHIAAVFACNFANHLWSIATDILHTSGYEFDVFRPLLRETLDKAFEIGAKQAQTGPARRGDTNVINAHLAKLDGDNHKLYELVTKMIISQHHEQNKF